MAQNRFLAHRARLLQDGRRAVSLAEQGLEVIHQDPRLLIADESD
ncbi:hypothetical protein [Candidatus Accumulibacter sp. ACC003]|nr:hypothetical protein [Candidatus Accumulibacter sp. ACC003]